MIYHDSEKTLKYLYFCKVKGSVICCHSNNYSSLEAFSLAPWKSCGQVYLFIVSFMEMLKKIGTLPGCQPHCISSQSSFFWTKGLLGPNLYTDGFNPSFVVFSNSVSLPLCKLYTLLVNIQSGCCMTASSSSKHDANEHTVLPLRKLRPTEKVVPVPNEERHVAVWKNLIGPSAHLEN